MASLLLAGRIGSRTSSPSGLLHDQHSDEILLFNDTQFDESGDFLIHPPCVKFKRFNDYGWEDLLLGLNVSYFARNDLNFRTFDNQAWRCLVDRDKQGEVAMNIEQIEKKMIHNQNRIKIS